MALCRSCQCLCTPAPPAPLATNYPPPPRGGWGGGLAAPFRTAIPGTLQLTPHTRPVPMPLLKPHTGASVIGGRTRGKGVAHGVRAKLGGALPICTFLDQNMATFHHLKMTSPKLF